MFDEIDKIPWSHLKVIEGSTSNIPSAINGLISDDIDKREKSYWQLDNHVVVQSDLYESAFYVIPFLVEILNSHYQNGRDKVYALLYEIGNGYPIDNSKINYEGGKLDLRHACRKDIAKHYKIYLSEIVNRESNFRILGLELIVSLDDNINNLIPLLAEILDFDDTFENEIAEAIEDIKEERQIKVNGSEGIVINGIKLDI